MVHGKRGEGGADGWLFSFGFTQNFLKKSRQVPSLVYEQLLYYYFHNVAWKVESLIVLSKPFDFQKPI